MPIALVEYKYPLPHAGLMSLSLILELISFEIAALDVLVYIFTRFPCPCHVTKNVKNGTYVFAFFIDEEALFFAKQYSIGTRVKKIGLCEPIIN